MARGARTSASRTGASSRSPRRSTAPRARRSTRPVCTSSPARSTPTSTSTTPAARTARASTTGTRALRRGRHDDGRRHAAQRPAADGRRAGVRPQARRGRARRPRRLRAVGRPRAGRRSTASTSSPRAASSASRRSCPTAGSPEFATADDLTLYEGMAAPPRSGCRSPSTPRARRSRAALAARARARRAARRARLPRLAPGDRRGRGDRPRAAARARRPAARCTSCTSRPAAGSRSSPRPGRAASTRRARPARTTSCFDEDDAERLGAVAKCAPPLRPRGRARRAVGARSATSRWSRPTIRPSLARAQGGRRLLRDLGRDHRLPGRCSAVLLDAGHHERGARRSSGSRSPAAGGAARRFGLPGKGRVEPGADADLALVDLAARPRSAADDAAPPPPPTARGPAVRCAAASRARCVRGTTVFADGRVAGRAAGRLVTPETTEES